MLVFVAFVEDFNDSEITRTVSQLVFGAQSDYEAIVFGTDIAKSSSALTLSKRIVI